jgi:uncharacterized RDD family membrane protein YckC
VQFDERLKIDTPEQIALELRVAGIGSRFLAVAVDTVLQTALIAAVATVAALGISTLPVLSIARTVRTIGPAVSIFLTFCLYWGYFAFFEIIWSGRTPGKRMAGIRVIDESGRPIAAYAAIGRNLLRAIDFLPAMYGVGVITMMLNRHSRRIGDFVAGTVVVYDTVGDEPRLGWPHATAAGDMAGPLTQVTAAELQLIEAYLSRRYDLDALVRDQMANEIVARVVRKTGARPPAGQSADEFLEGVARRVRDGARFR